MKWSGILPSYSKVVFCLLIKSLIKWKQRVKQIEDQTITTNDQKTYNYFIHTWLVFSSWLHICTLQIDVSYEPFKFPNLLKFYLGVCKPTHGSSNELMSDSQSSKNSITSKHSFKHWSFILNCAWKDHLFMPYILTMLRYSLWLILIISSAFQARLYH
jgi:hypothetical protein